MWCLNVNIVNMHYTNRVILWGADDFNMLGLLRELGSEGFDLFFIIKGKAGCAAKSKYCTNYIEINSIQDGFNYLMTLDVVEDSKPILITSGDGISVFIDQHKVELEKKFVIPGTSQQGILEKYTDKYDMACLASEIGMTVPWSKFIKWDSDITDITYPCIIKPSHQIPGHYNEFKYKICKNERSLRRTLKYVRHESVFIVQQLVPKERDLLVYGARLRDGNTVFAGYMIRDRMADSGSFSHGVLTNTPPPQFKSDKVDQMRNFLEKIDYYGLFSFEYGLTAEDAYFFEVNLRNDGTSHYFFQAGANIPAAWVISCMGGDYSAVSTSVGEDKWFVDELFDVENVFHCRLSYKQYKKDKREATVFKYFDAEDVEPFNYLKKRRVKQLLQDIILKRFRLYIIFVLDKLGLRK